MMIADPGRQRTDSPRGHDSRGTQESMALVMVFGIGVGSAIGVDSGNVPIGAVIGAALSA